MQSYLTFLIGVVAALIAFVVVFNLLATSLKTVEKQKALTEFSGFITDVESICRQETSANLVKTYSLPSSVEIIYSTNNKEIPSNSKELIKNHVFGNGIYVCLKFKDESELKCALIECTVCMEYVGVSDDYSDLSLMIKKILDQPIRKDYKLNVIKNDTLSIVVFERSKYARACGYTGTGFS